MAVFPESVVIIMLGPPPEITQTRDRHLILGKKLKFLTPPGFEPEPLGCKAETTDYAIGMDETK